MRSFQLAAAIIGLAVSIYLSVIKLSNEAATCLPGIGDCAAVNNSVFSEIAGIPIAIFGSAAYFAIIVILLVEFYSSQNTFLRKARWITPYLLFGISLTGVLYSAYLTYLEIFVIKAICPLCVLSAVAMAALFVISVIRILADNGEPNHQPGGR